MCLSILTPKSFSSLASSMRLPFKWRFKVELLACPNFRRVAMSRCFYLRAFTAKQTNVIPNKIMPHYTLGGNIHATSNSTALISFKSIRNLYLSQTNWKPIRNYFLTYFTAQTSFSFISRPGIRLGNGGFSSEKSANVFPLQYEGEIKKSQKSPFSISV